MLLEDFGDHTRTQRSDVLANTIDHGGASVHGQLGANDGFRLPEAVAEETRAFRLLVPHRHTEIIHVEAIAGVARIAHDVAGRVTAESIVSQLNASKATSVNSALTV